MNERIIRGWARNEIAKADKGNQLNETLVRAIATSAARRVKSERDSGYEVQTTDDTLTEIGTIEIEDETGGLVEVRIKAVESTGAGTDAFYYVGSYNKTGGDIALETPAPLYELDALGTVVSITGSAGNILVEVTGVAATTFNWRMEVKIT